jgi:FMN-dependent oxidoreductase (nitrilotriacetate monooxygenase family)
MHLCMFIGSSGNHQGAWRRPNSRVEEIMSLSLFSDIAQWAERGKLDAVLVADLLGLDTPRVRTDPMGRLEPFTLLAALAARTSHLGLIGSVSTSFYEPFNMARQMASLDHLSGGRAAWNIVTSATGEANFGAGELPSQTRRYARAAEFVDVVTQLWDCWADDAIVIDREGGAYADPDKVRRIDHLGEHFQVAGPLNVPRSPQGRPVFVQAGSSAAGIAFAARHAEVVFTAQQTLEDSRAFYDKLRGQITRRDPDQVTILPGVTPILGATEAEARGTAKELGELIDLDTGLVRLRKWLGGVDLGRLDLDERIPPELLPPVESMQGRQSRYAIFKELAQTHSLRRLVQIEVSSSGHWTPVGSCEQVADQLAERFLAGACDGFVVIPTHLPEGVQLLVDGVVPHLRRRGLFRTDYTGPTLRDHLGLPRPARS